MAVKKRASKKKAGGKKKVARKTTAAKKQAPRKKVSKKKVTAQKKTSKKKAAPKKKTASKKAATKKAVVKKAVKKKTASKAAKKKTPARKPAKTAIRKVEPQVEAPVEEVTVPTGPALADPQLMKIREKLIQDRNELMKMIRSSQEVERNIGDITFSNEIDLASSLEGREMAFQLSSRERNELRMIEDALIRINKGTYGICETCSKRIAIKRLQIMPLTPLCIECQANLEVG